MPPPELDHETKTHFTPERFTAMHDLRVMTTGSGNGSRASDVQTLIDLLQNIGGAQGQDPAAEEPQPPSQDPVDVYIRVVFIKLGDINTLNENFSADVYIQARWREPRMDGQGKSEEREWITWREYWNPKLFVENVLGHPEESVWHQVAFDTGGQATVHERRRVKGNFLETMELRTYPFDIQELSLVITTHRGEQEVHLAADPNEISTVNSETFVDRQEWKLYDHISSVDRVTTNAYKSSKYKHPSLVISCRAARKFTFFIWNIILIMIFICSLVFTTFVVDTDLVQNRLQLSFILLLSNLTFKFNISQTLPKVSYLTRLDIYVIVSMAILTLVCVWHAVVYLVFLNYGQATSDTADMVATIIIGSIYVAFNLGFFFTSVVLVRDRRIRLVMKDKMQKKMLILMEHDRSRTAKILPLVMGEAKGQDGVDGGGRGSTVSM